LNGNSFRNYFVFGRKRAAFGATIGRGAKVVSADGAVIEFRAIALCGICVSKYLQSDDERGHQKREEECQGKGRFGRPVIVSKIEIFLLCGHPEVMIVTKINGILAKVQNRYPDPKWGCDCDTGVEKPSPWAFHWVEL
jgi:hypothetical protein